jgi:replication initiation and membrane attachment protein DnaB
VKLKRKLALAAERQRIETEQRAARESKKRKHGPEREKPRRLKLSASKQSRQKPPAWLRERIADEQQSAKLT